MFENNLIAGVSGQGGGYSIEDSLRFNDNDSAYLSRTPSVAGNRKTWTWSGWVKRGNLLSDNTAIFAVTSNETNSPEANEFSLRYNSVQALNIAGYIGAYQIALTTLGLYRDISAWYHIVLAIDTTQSTSTDRVKLYVNGIESQLTGTYPAQNHDPIVNTTLTHKHGFFGAYAPYRFDGYLAEINFIDGQALTPDSFGEINETTGEWSPIKYAGTYGTNGFYLPFDGNANDSSGNGNNWTENNLASTDYMIDTPTNNFSVLNPLASGGVTFQEGNLEANLSTTDPRSTITTIPVSSGKWYAEVYYNSNTIDGLMLGVVTDSYSPVSGTTRAHQVSSGGGSIAYFLNDGHKRIDTVDSSYGSSATTGDIIGVALNLDDDEITFYKNNVSQGTITTKSFSGGYNFFLSNGAGSGNQRATLNQGADSSFAGNKTRQGNTDANGKGDFYYAPPAGGYLALCTDNLPAPAIVQPETQFNVVTYTGNGTTQAITGVGFQPDMVWIKVRSTNYDHQIHDSVRGAGLGLLTNTADAEANYATVTSFDSDGFTVDASSFIGTNASGETFVAWCWKAGGTAVSNTDGSITSQVSANVDAGFSVVSYTGEAAARTVGHGLSSAPEMVIIKNRDDATRNWLVWHKDLSASAFIFLSLVNAEVIDTRIEGGQPRPFGPFTSTTFGVNIDNETGHTNDYIAYCFHSVESFSKFGSFVGNGSADGPFVYTGFKVALLMVKRTDSASPWLMYDNARGTFNQTDNLLRANTSQAETGSGELDFLSNGFKYRGSSTNADYVTNVSGGTYIYMAFAEHPFNYATGR